MPRPLSSPARVSVKFARHEEEQIDRLSLSLENVQRLMAVEALVSGVLT
jgi:hypothetical protein